MEDLDKINLCFLDPTQVEFVSDNVVAAMEEFKYFMSQEKNGIIMDDTLYKAFLDLAANCCEFKNAFQYYSKYRRTPSDKR